MIKLHHCKNEDLFPDILNESLDIVCIDPPYKYLKNQKLEVDFDEQLFFENCKRVLKKDGFIILFGRGTSFYRWNVILENLGFTFKEEIIWDKRMISSPLMNLNRVHETISIFTKGKGIIKKNKVPYLEMKGHDLESIIKDVNRLKSVFKNTKSLDAILDYLENKNFGFTEKHTTRHGVQVEGHTKDRDRNMNTIASICQGYTEKSIISGSERKAKFNSTVQPSNLINEERKVATLKIVDEGMTEKSIIPQSRDHYTSIHPTQKPVRLLERLIQLVLPKTGGVVIADFFGGSFSTMEAVVNLQKTYPNLQLEGISCEMDQEYFDLGKKRIDEILQTNNKQLQLL